MRDLVNYIIRSLSTFFYYFDTHFSVAALIKLTKRIYYDIIIFVALQLLQ